MGYEQPFFQDFESFLRTIRTEEHDINFVLLNYKSNFESNEIPQGLFEVSAINNTSENLVKNSVYFDFITIKSRLKANNVSKFDFKKLFLK